MASADDIEAAQQAKLLGYWENRAQARVLATDRTEEAVNREVLQAYASTTNAIEGELRAFYERFATESGLTPEAARATLSVRERADFRADLAAKQEAIRALPGPLSEQLQAYLDDLGEASKLRKVTRQQRLMLDLEHELSGMSARVESRLETGMSKAFEQRYEGNAKDLAKVPAFRAELGAPAPRLLEQATTEKWLGQNFSDRIWDDKDKLVGELRRILSQAAVSHSGIEALTKKMARAMGSSLDNARRLVRTELNYVANQATLEGYRQSGVKRYKFLAAIDSRTSELCRRANGQVYAVAEAAVGVNFPPLHPNCRSTTVAAFDEEDLAERYDFSDVQLSDEELAALGVTREEYLEATGQVKPGAKPIALSKREAQRAEDALNQAPIEGESLRVNGRLDRLGEDLRFERELEQTLDKGKVPHTKATLEVRQERLRELRGRLGKEELRVGELEQRAADALPVKRSRIGKMVAKARAGMERWKGYFNAMVERFLESKSKLVVHGAPPSGNASPFADVTPVDLEIDASMAIVASDEVDTQKLWDPAPAVAKYPVLGVLGDSLAVFDWDSTDQAARRAARKHAAELALMPENVLSYIARNGGRIAVGGRPIEEMGEFLDLGVDWGAKVQRWNRAMRDLPGIYLPHIKVSLAGVASLHSGSMSVVLHEASHAVVDATKIAESPLMRAIYDDMLQRNQLHPYFLPLWPGDAGGRVELLTETLAAALFDREAAIRQYGVDLVDSILALASEVP